MNDFPKLDQTNQYPHNLNEFSESFKSGFSSKQRQLDDPFADLLCRPGFKPRPNPKRTAKFSDTRIFSESEQMTYILILVLKSLAATCSGSYLQPLVAQTSKFQHCTLSSLRKNCKISSPLPLQKFGIYSRKSIGLFHDFSARSSRENRNFFAERHCRRLGFLQNCVRRNHDILRTEVAVTCSHLAATAKWKIEMRNSCELNGLFGHVFYFCAR